jgi:selenocysteine lyase/cysteine desulfurase
VALSGAYNVTGYLPPLREAARLAHRYGARILVDGAQLVPHRPVSMRPSAPDADDGFDFLVFSGHKIYAPYGSGVLVVPRDVFANGTPTELGGGIVEMVMLDQVLWSDLPDREEAGSPNVLGAVALHAAVQRLEALGMDAVAAHERELTAYALEQVQRIPGLRLLGPDGSDERLGVLSFVIEGMPHTLVASILSHEWAVGVRSGCFCAHPGMLHLLRISREQAHRVSTRIALGDKRDVPGAVRASVGLYVTRADIDVLVEGLEAIVAGRYQRVYEQDVASGEYFPRAWNLSVGPQAFDHGLRAAV